MREIWTMYVFQKAEFIQNLENKILCILDFFLSFFLSLLYLSIIYFMK